MDMSNAHLSPLQASLLNPFGDNEHLTADQWYRLKKNAEKAAMEGAAPDTKLLSDLAEGITSLRPYT